MSTIVKRPTISMVLVASISSAQAAKPWPVIRDFGGATARNEKTWINHLDYPDVAVSNGQQGNVIVKFDIQEDGRVQNCTVEVSSGFASLDAVPCRLLEKRARFKPATNSEGKAIATRGRYSIPFWMP